MIIIIIMLFRVPRPQAIFLLAFFACPWIIWGRVRTYWTWSTWQLLSIACVAGAKGDGIGEVKNATCLFFTTRLPFPPFLPVLRLVRRLFSVRLPLCYLVIRRPIHNITQRLNDLLSKILLQPLKSLGLSHKIRDAPTPRSRILIAWFL